MKALCGQLRSQAISKYQFSLCKLERKMSYGVRIKHYQPYNYGNCTYLCSESTQGRNNTKDFCKSMIMCQISFAISILFRYPAIPWFDWILLGSAAVIIGVNIKRYFNA